MRGALALHALPVGSSTDGASPNAASICRCAQRIQHLSLRDARSRQKTAEFKKRYHARAGIEGTLSTGIHNSGMRRSRYIGLAKTHLQNVAIAAELNVCRLVAWLEGVPRSTTRVFPFARLCGSPALTA